MANISVFDRSFNFKYRFINLINLGREINDGGNFKFTLATDSKQKWEGIVLVCREEKQIETLISTNIYINELNLYKNIWNVWKDI